MTFPTRTRTNYGMAANGTSWSIFSGISLAAGGVAVLFLATANNPTITSTSTTAWTQWPWTSAETALRYDIYTFKNTGTSSVNIDFSATFGASTRSQAILILNTPANVYDECFVDVSATASGNGTSYDPPALTTPGLASFDAVSFAARANTAAFSGGVPSNYGNAVSRAPAGIAPALATVERQLVYSQVPTDTIDPGAYSNSNTGPWNTYTVTVWEKAKLDDYPAFTPYEFMMGTTGAGAATMPPGTGGLLLAFCVTANEDVTIAGGSADWTLLGEAGIGTAGNAAASRLEVYARVSTGADTLNTNDPGNHLGISVQRILHRDGTPSIDDIAFGTHAVSSDKTYWQPVDANGPNRLVIQAYTNSFDGTLSTVTNLEADIATTGPCADPLIAYNGGITAGNGSALWLMKARRATAGTVGAGGDDVMTHSTLTHSGVSCTITIAPPVTAPARDLPRSHFWL